MLRYQALGNYFFMGNTPEELARSYWQFSFDDPPVTPPPPFAEWMAERADWSRRWDDSVIRTDTVQHFMEDLEACDHIRPIPAGHIAIFSRDGKLFVAENYDDMVEQLWKSRFQPEPTLLEWMASNQNGYRTMDGSLTHVLRMDSAQNHLEDLIATGWCKRMPDA